jgi:serine/threonine-protein kinase
MELLRGEELSVRLKREGKLPLDLVARIVHPLCRALSVVHEAGVVHRDVKPSNVFLCRADAHGGLLVKLMDFGVAKVAVEADGAETTRAGVIIGTPAYMSPEQVLAARQIDLRADLWSVAALVYRMVTGVTPFGPGTFAELGIRILTVSPLPPTSVDPALPKALDAFIAKGMARRPEDRFSSARALSSALLEIAGLRPRDLSVDDRRAMKALRESPTLSPITHPGLDSIAAIRLAAEGRGARRSEPRDLFGGVGGGAHDRDAAPARSPTAASTSGIRAVSPRAPRSLFGLAIAISAAVGLLAVLMFARRVGPPSPRSVAAAGASAAPRPLDAPSPSPSAIVAAASLAAPPRTEPASATPRKPTPQRPKSTLKEEASKLWKKSDEL